MDEQRFVDDIELRLQRAVEKLDAQAKTLERETGDGIEIATRVMLQMRANKAQLEFNRALLDLADPEPEAATPR